MSTETGPGAGARTGSWVRRGNRRSRERWRAVPTYGRLLGVIVPLVVALVVVGVDMVQNSAVRGPGFLELGKWCLTAATALLSAGLLAAVIKLLDERRSRRVAWESQLYELVHLNQKLRTAARMIRAHPDTATFRTEMDKVLVLRGELRSIAARAHIDDQSDVGPAVKDMLRYLRRLWNEYEKIKMTTVASDAPVDALLAGSPLLEAFVYRKGEGAGADYRAAYRAGKAWMRYYGRLSHRRPDRYPAPGPHPAPSAATEPTDVEDAEDDEGGALLATT